METPAIPMPNDAREQEILQKLTAIRDQLLLLKMDRTKYIRSQDVMVQYQELVEQVKLLNEVRKGAHLGENRLDKVLESCFQLISLFFMTIGRTTDVPAAYALTSTVKRLLDHLTEAGLFSPKDLDSLSDTLGRLDGILKNANAQHSPYLVELLSKREELCKTMLAKLREKLDELDKPLQAIYERLISIMRSMSLANTKTKFATSEVQKLQAKLKEIEESRVDGKFVDEEGNEIRGSDLVSALLARCLRWSDIVLERKGQIPEAFRTKYEILTGVRNDLEKLSITQAWSLRETDLYDFQRELDKIDESRVDGNWVDDEGNPAELYVQRTLLYLIRRSYGYIYYLMNSSEPVSEALLPVYNQLQTLKRCLVEVKNSGGVSSVRELYPYSMKLNSIDNMRVDGKFMVGNDIPEGQGSVSELLAECFDLSYELRVAAEELEDGSADS
ncbi:uncharacterized protein PODANS_2_13090 [Podospora anserina S mat+]|uniref:Podospora anserina S mat+ genomic DNA chromosome 2, supercontig 2 n=1 Tax=Podospora anserina (strain S / ATCC MYA-4624 / DSM 980 / FGSC 10383) TaxID=515849 RepID=B2B827_PODAN|nr:uncharacterized protein PODANS_2_13090 [Podospora anserina S mat+]CAP73956.1 unnamed protein product [Podospora anserina S mat+]CDP26357.1 Putative protein similar to YPL260W of Saccharomyces cerevisiae [Podospora anserina S mat+]